MVLHEKITVERRDRMRKKYWIISISILTVTVALASIAVGSYSLFSQRILIVNHFVTGELKLDLFRTNLSWNELDDDGLLVEYEDNQEYKASELDNLFANSNSSKVIVPGIHYQSTMKLVNDGDIAFDYYIEIVLKGDANALASQLEVTYISGDVVHKNNLSEGLFLGSLENPLGKAITEEEINFSIKVEFIVSENNNDAKGSEVSFDFIVYAVQSTK